MERRVLLAIFLAFVVLYAWQALFVKPVPKRAPATNATSTAPGQERPVTPGITPAQTPLTPAAVPAAVAASTASPIVGEPSERDVRVETRDVIAVFTNRGARLKSWRLKHYLDSQKQPQELVEHDLSSQPLPFSLRTANDALTATVNGAVYAVDGAPAAAAASSPIDLRFEYRDSAGVRAVKEFHFEPSSYVVAFRAMVADGERPVDSAIVWGPAIGDVGE